MARPSKYRPEMCAQAAQLCSLFGATDEELASYFRVSERTINTWKALHAEFRESLERGKQVADKRVEQSLYRSALGYTHEAVKIFCDWEDLPAKGEKPARRRRRVTRVKYTEHVPPHVTACIFWLKNRMPEFWRDKFDVDEGLPRERAAELLQLVEKRLAELAQTPAGADPDARGTGAPH